MNFPNNLTNQFQKIRWLQWLGFAIVIAVVFFQFKTYGQSFQNISDIKDPESLALALPLVMIVLAFHAINWGSILRSLGNYLPFYEVLFIYACSSLIRYIPGTYWYVISRTTMGVKKGLSSANMLLSTGLELVIKVFSGLIVLFIAMLSGIKLQVEQIGWIAVWILMGVCLFFYINLSKRNKSQFRNAWLETLQKPLQLVKTSPQIFGFWIIIYLLSWIIQGIVLWIIINIWNPIDIKYMIWTIFAYTVGWISGFLNPFTPSGLGAREAVVMAVLAPSVPAYVILGASVIMRILVLFGETILTVIGWVANHQKRPPTIKIGSL